MLIKPALENRLCQNCKLLLEIETIRSRGRVWKYKGMAKVKETIMADAEWAATIMDRSQQ